jgi:hypothetical protein
MEQRAANERPLNGGFETRTFLPASLLLLSLLPAAQAQDAATPAAPQPATSATASATPTPQVAAPTPETPANPTLTTPAPDILTPQTRNPNEVLPAPPLIPPATPEVQPSKPEDAVEKPAPPSTLAPGDEELFSGVEPPGGNYTMESPSGVIYDMERGYAVARGPVTFRYREFTVKGDRGLVDYNTNRATLSGNLTVEVQGRTFRGGTLSFDLDSGRWRLTKIETEFPPDFFPPGTVLEPVLVRDGIVSGQGDDVRGEQIKVTTCDREHYYLISKRLEFYRTPDGRPERIVARRNSLYVLGQKILPLPVYVVSLLGERARRQPLQSTFGQNQTDGYFVKSIYNLRANDKRTDSALIDLLQRRGVGLGLQREYAAGAGLLYLYGVSGQKGQNGREVDARVQRAFRINSLMRGDFRLDSTQNNSVTGEGIGARNTQLSLYREGARAQTSAIVTTNQSTFGSLKSSYGSIQVNHRQDFGAGLHLEAASGLNQSKSSGFETATSDQSLTLSKTGSLFDLYLRTELHDDLINDRTYQVERLPELTLQSTTDRMKIAGINDIVPGSFTFALGRFTEPTGDSSTTTRDRFDFFYNVNDRTSRLLGGGKSTFSELRTGASFEQAFYSDSSARYNYSYNLGLNNKMGPIQAQANYYKQRTFGFTPFSFDFTVPGEYIDTSLSYQPSEKFRFNLTGGRDIENSFTRDVIGKVQWAPSKSFYTSFGTSFAPEGNDFGDVYANMRLIRPRQRFLGGSIALGMRYSPAESQLARVNTSLDVQLGSKIRVQALAGYNGISKTFDFSQIRVTRDMHCFNLYATYDGQRQELRFDIALKAFPFADSRYGRNEFSEGFDAFVGETQ